MSSIFRTVINPPQHPTHRSIRNVIVIHSFKPYILLASTNVVGVLQESLPSHPSSLRAMRSTATTARDRDRDP